MKTYCVYILTNVRHGTLYVGVTNALQRRMIEHKLEKFEGFTQMYGLKMLVYIEQYEYINDAIRREKLLKRWNRAWKIKLIEEKNPDWQDLYESFFGAFNADDWRDASD